ncbi:hypothetical protein SAMN05216464_10769 [Mucilaginibacter pineti]|uniref:Adhesin n=1 Tax=Mucilaginibacter pineti TaxID=1391627 RepID=A0A1G7DQQ4_9SPHI|nr:hypothetical protein [Mucilaginibacter pineti]SDE53480.1 hypothetical protein SAMN05216464_10769 [Mucilaginibacter pineti]
MKSKIFNPFLFALMVLITVCSNTFAQVTPAPPVSPKPLPAPPASDMKPLEKLDDKDFQLKMNDLKIQMRDLQVKMNALNKLKIEKTMKLSAKKFKSFSKNFNFKFDSLKTFTYKSLDSSLNFSFSTDLAPKIAYGFKDFDNNFTFFSNEEDTATKRSGKDDGIEKIKNYSKSYSVDGNDVINIDNRFGKITVNTWAKNEVKVDVQIKVVANDDDKAQKLLDNVKIMDSKDGSDVFFKTYIKSDDDNNGSWSSLFSGKRSSSHSISINYTVYMPAKSALNITNKYGSTNLPDLDGKLNINNSYGSLVAKVLSHTGNQIKVRYGSANIGSLNDSELDVAYGSLDLGDCNKLNADVSYGSAKIGRITTSGNINLKFGGGLNINEVDKNVKNLSVTSSYSSVKLGIGSDHNADFDVTIHYGSFNYDGHDVNITSKTPADGERGFNPTKNYKGHLGKGASEKTITVTSNYGSVKFD